jgi:hypothetical protein
MTTSQLDVAKAYPNDSGRGIARLDPDILLHLKLSPGDIIEIEGSDTTAAKVWRADRQDWNTDTVHLDGFTRQNAETAIGEPVTIRSVGAKPADRVVLTPPDEATVQFESTATDMIWRQIAKRPVGEGDIVPVMPSTNHPFMRSPGQAVSLIAVETAPDGVVVVTEETTVELDSLALEGAENATLAFPFLANGAANQIPLQVTLRSSADGLDVDVVTIRRGNTVSGMNRFTPVTRKEITEHLSRGDAAVLQLAAADETYRVVPVLSWNRDSRGKLTVTAVEIDDVIFE